MFRILLHWVLSAVALLLVGRMVPGFHLDGFTSALVAAVIIGLLNATLGLMLKIVTLPLAVLTLGLFLLVINAFILKFASHLVPGFTVDTYKAAFIGAAVLSVISLIFGALFRTGDA